MPFEIRLTAAIKTNNITSICENPTNDHETFLSTSAPLPHKIVGDWVIVVNRGQLRDAHQKTYRGGGGGRAKYKKKYSRKGKLNEKNSCTPINPKKYSCFGLKKFIQGI